MPEKRTIFILPILIRFHAVADNEQGWFPRRPFHWCANHLIDQYRSCKHCQKPLTSLEEFAAKLLAVDRHEDALQVYEVLTDFAHAHAHVCPYTPRTLVRRPLREGRYTECVYMLSMTGTPSLKIGRTGQPTPHKRFLELRRGNPTLKVEAFFPCQRSVYMEWF